MRIILRNAVKRGRSTRNLAEIARAHFGPDNGVDLELPPRGPMRECVHLALAHRIGATVVTADRRFVTAVAPTEHGETVVTLTDYAGTR